MSMVCCVLPVEGEPAIFTNSGSRESFFLRELTWIQDLSYRGALVGNAVRAALEASGIPSGRIGTAGLSVLSLRQLRDLQQALSSYRSRTCPRFCARCAPHRARANGARWRLRLAWRRRRRAPPIGLRQGRVECCRGDRGGARRALRRCLGCADFGQPQRCGIASLRSALRCAACAVVAVDRHALPGVLGRSGRRLVIAGRGRG